MLKCAPLMTGFSFVFAEEIAQFLVRCRRNTARLRMPFGLGAISDDFQQDGRRIRPVAPGWRAFISRKAAATAAGRRQLHACPDAGAHIRRGRRYMARRDEDINRIRFKPGKTSCLPPAPICRHHAGENESQILRFIYFHEFRHIDSFT